MQFIIDDEQQCLGVFLSVKEYNLLLKRSECQVDSPDASAPVSDYVQTLYDVWKIKKKKSVSLVAAWRIYRGLSQKHVAEMLGITQGRMSQLEKTNRPRKSTIVKLAEIYDCKVENLLEES